MGASYTGPWLFFGRHAYIWSRKFAWLPKLSDQTGRRIWLCYAYYGYRLIEGPGSPVKVQVWLTEEEYTWQCLTGNPEWYKD